MGEPSKVPIEVARASLSGNHRFQLYQLSASSKFDHPIAVDFLTLGHAVHLADRAVPRRRRVDGDRRCIRVDVPVSNLQIWPRVTERVENLVSFATSDSWRIRWVASSETRRRRVEATSTTQATDVALFSGGLDSLCWAADLARTHGSKPIFVTHSPPGLDRVRTMLNGVWQSAGRDPSETPVARQAHLYLLDGISKLIADVDPDHATWNVKNPFATMTKGDCCRLLVDDSKHSEVIEKLAQTTLTCEYTGQQAATIRGWLAKNPGKVPRPIGNGPQCGLCVPCLVHRAALLAAGIKDSPNNYFFGTKHALQSALKYRRSDYSSLPLWNAVVSHPFYLQRFCNQLLMMTEAEFTTRFLPELRFIPVASSLVQDQASQEFALMQRFAKEILEFTG